MFYFRLIFLFLFCVHARVAAQSPVVLSGRIVAAESGEGISNITVRVSGEAHDVTTGSGHFKITLPSRFRVGDKIEFTLDDSGWIIERPADGQMYIPANPDDLIRITVRAREKIREDIALLEKISKQVAANQKIRLDEIQTRRLQNIVQKQKVTVDSLSILLYSYMHATRRLSNRYEELVYALSRDFPGPQIEDKADELSAAVYDHNRIYARVNQQKFKYRSDIQLYWNDETLSEQLSDVFHLILIEMNEECILKLNHLSNLIHEYYYGANKRREQKEELKREIVAQKKELLSKQNEYNKRLETETTLFLDKLNNGIRNSNRILREIEEKGGNR